MERQTPRPKPVKPLVYPLWLLRQGGLARPQLAALLAAGRITRLRRGWYALPGADRFVALAVQAGGCLSCVSALRWYGVWVPPTLGVHMRAYRNRVTPGSANVIRCGNSHSLSAPQTAVDPLLDAFSVAWSCLNDEGRVVVMDSLLNLELARPSELAATLNGREGAADLMAKCDRSESGTETITRLRLRARQIRVRPQVWIAGVGRVDLLIGQRLVVECDSRQHHTDQTAYQRDRDRDRILHARGYVVIRLTYQDVMTRWEEVEADILAIIRRRGHRPFPIGEGTQQAS